MNVLCQRMVVDENSIPLVKQTFKSGSHKGRYFYQHGDHPFFSLVYTCRCFTGVIACLINQGKNVKRIQAVKVVISWDWAPHCKLFLQNYWISGCICH